MSSSSFVDEPVLMRLEPRDPTMAAATDVVPGKHPLGSTRVTVSDRSNSGGEDSLLTYPWRVGVALTTWLIHAGRTPVVGGTLATTPARKLTTAIERIGGALDDLAELTVTARRIADQLDALAITAETLNDSADTISRDAIVIAGALPHVERLATFVDRLPGGRRRDRTQSTNPGRNATHWQP